MRPDPSLDSRHSWFVASAATGAIAVAFGSAWIAPLSLKSIASEVGNARSIPSLTASLVWFGAGCGGIPMTLLAERIGVRSTVILGSAMICVGLALSAVGPPMFLYLGHGLFVGAVGIAGINAPLFVYVCRWFDRRRGAAVALLSSGNYLAGALAPLVLQISIERFGWRSTMLSYAILQVSILVPIALAFFRPPPLMSLSDVEMASRKVTRVFGFPANVVFAILAAASFLCCVPMAMPQGHLSALCGDLGINASHGAFMVSTLLGTAFISRYFWGALADRIGGLRAALAGSICQIVAMILLLLSRDEFTLFSSAAVFGFGFSGLVPAYVLCVRELFTPSEAAWRIPTLLLVSGSGMAVGGWLAGWMYDQFGYYAPAFLAGVSVNVLNLSLLIFLVWANNTMPNAGEPLSR